MRHRETQTVNDKSVGSPESFVNQFYVQYRRLSSEEQRLLLLNMHAQLRRVSRKREVSCDLHQLTRRETEVLVLVANGYCRKEVATCLEISVNTAARHIANIYAKLGIGTVAEATRVAIANRLTPQPATEANALVI